MQNAKQYRLRLYIYASQHAIWPVNPILQLADMLSHTETSLPYTFLIVATRRTRMQIYRQQCSGAAGKQKAQDLLVFILLRLPVKAAQQFG